jgi:hypothetical protein
LADPLFWLALSFLLVVISLTAVLMVAIPALRELGRAARSAEKLFDTLGRELPPTLEAIRLTGLEITELTDDVTEGVQSAGQVVQQVNQSLTSAQTGAKRLNTGTKSLFAGARAAWRALTTDEPPQAGRRPSARDSALSQSRAPGELESLLDVNQPESPRSALRDQPHPEDETNGFSLEPLAEDAYGNRPPTDPPNRVLPEASSTPFSPAAEPVELTIPRSPQDTNRQL